MTMTAKELRELDAWIAEHVMGWRLVNYETGCEASCYAEAANNDGWTWDGSEEAWKWKPSTDASCAMQVLEKCISNLRGLHAGDPCFFISKDGPEFWLRTVVGHQHLEGCSNSLPLAICLFAQKLFSK